MHDILIISLDGLPVSISRPCQCDALQLCDLLVEQQKVGQMGSQSVRQTNGQSHREGAGPAHWKRKGFIFQKLTSGGRQQQQALGWYGPLESRPA